MRLLIACLAAIFSFASSTSLPPQSSTPQATTPAIKYAPASYTDPSSGFQMFNAYCASCHGIGGIGNGPAAPALKTAPANLRQLAAKNRGTFPELQVAQAIKGDGMTAAHGSKEMPVWGPVFLYLGHHDPAVLQLRVRNLTRYIASLQQK